MPDQYEQKTREFYASDPSGRRWLEKTSRNRLRQLKYEDKVDILAVNNYFVWQLVEFDKDGQADLNVCLTYQVAKALADSTDNETFIKAVKVILPADLLNE